MPPEGAGFALCVAQVARHARAALERIRGLRWGWLRRAGCARWLACALLLWLLLCAAQSWAAPHPAKAEIAEIAEIAETSTSVLMTSVQTAAAPARPPTVARSHRNNHSRARADLDTPPPHNLLEAARQLGRPTLGRPGHLGRIPSGTGLPYALECLLYAHCGGSGEPEPIACQSLRART